MSAITDYASLKTAVSNWLHRTDLDSYVGDFISLAEGRMSADINARPMETRTSLAVTSGNAYVTLPTDMLEMSRLIVQTDPIYTLQYRSADQISTEYPTSQVGEPRVFCVIGADVQLAPIPDADYTMELTYMQRIPSLSSTNTTNWLITAFPNAYLYAALCAAQPYIANDARLPIFEKLYLDSVKAINSIDWYSGSTMRVRAK
jgi:hypothetical protein